MDVTLAGVSPKLIGHVPRSLPGLNDGLSLERGRPL